MRTNRESPVTIPGKKGGKKMATHSVFDYVPTVRMKCRLGSRDDGKTWHVEEVFSVSQPPKGPLRRGKRGDPEPFYGMTLLRVRRCPHCGQETTNVS